MLTPAVLVAQQVKSHGTIAVVRHALKFKVRLMPGVSGFWWLLSSCLTRRWQLFTP